MRFVAKFPSPEAYQAFCQAGGTTLRPPVDRPMPTAPIDEANTELARKHGALVEEDIQAVTSN